MQVAVRSLLLPYALCAGGLGTLDPVHAVGEVLVKIDRLTAEERRVVREALRVLVPVCGRSVEAALAGTLLMARIEEDARGLSAQVRTRRESEGFPLSGPAVVPAWNAIALESNYNFDRLTAASLGVPLRTATTTSQASA